MLSAPGLHRADVELVVVPPLDPKPTPIHPGLAAVLGFVVPIYFLPGVGTAIPQLLRMTLLGLVLASAFAMRGAVAFKVHPGWYLLATAYVWSAGVNLDRTAVEYAVTILACAPAGRAIAENGTIDHFLAGFRVAVFLSALVAIGDEIGIISVATPVVQTYGSPGLSLRSTAFAFEIAAALVAWFWRGRRHGDLRCTLWMIEGAVLILALAVSGGRGGCVAAVVAIFLDAVRGPRRKHLTAILAGVGAAIVWAAATDNIPDTFGRLIGMTDQEWKAEEYSYTSSRTDIYRATLEQPFSDLIFGVGASERVTLDDGSRYLPHNGILTVLFQAGILAAASGVVLLGAGLRKLGPSERSDNPMTLLIRSLLVVYLVRSLTENSGPLIGGVGVFLFSMVLHPFTGPMAPAAPGRRTPAVVCSPPSNPRVRRGGPDSLGGDGRELAPRSQSRGCDR